jgi:precorrin-6Y C5,15-methyltransferase (decarboxylating)
MSPDDLTATHRGLIEAADILVGGARHLRHFSEHRAEKKEISGALKAIVDFIRQRMNHKAIVVLASGDPLFYGIGTMLVEALGADRVKVYPNISAVAAAFARINESWHDATVVSLHGRASENRLLAALEQCDKIAVLTDPTRNPGWLANFCLSQGPVDFRLCVFERLGSEDETVGWYEPTQAAVQSFAEPNLVVLKRRESGGTTADALHLGMPEQRFARRGGLITKAEIRAVVIAKLRLAAGHVLWDLGAGSGSVAIEAAVIVKTGAIIAVEKEPARIRDIQANIARFGIANLQAVQADLPEGLDDLPRPHRVFVGGGGKALAAILRAVDARLQPGGVIVVNTVVLENLLAATDVLADLGYRSDTVQVQVSRSRPMPGGRRLEAENPVWVLTAQRD